MLLDASAERRHAPTAEASWQEWWSFEAVTADGAGLLVRWTLHRHSCWYWAYLALPDRSLIVVRHDDVALPAGRTLEIRADALWAEGVCEVPFEHWSLGLEAFALRLDRAADGWGSERGERLPFGFELDWERTGEPVSAQESAAVYHQPGQLTGELALGPSRWSLRAPALRAHGWGARDRARELRIVTPDARLRRFDGESLTIERASDGLPVRALAVRDAARVELSVTAAAAITTPEGRLSLAAGRAVETGGAGWLEVAE